MSVVPLFQHAALDPEALDAAASAYVIARDELHLKDHIDPLTHALAAKVVEAAQTGERDVERLARKAIDALKREMNNGTT